MDPNACYQDLIEALLAQEWDTAVALAEDLLAWVDQGGFEPATVSLPLDVTQLDFHAQRYGSAAVLRDYSPDGAHVPLWAVACALAYTSEDGGNPGTIPCLGGGPLAQWEAAVSRLLS